MFFFDVSKLVSSSGISIGDSKDVVFAEEDNKEVVFDVDVTFSFLPGPSKTCLFDRNPTSAFPLPLLQQ